VKKALSVVAVLLVLLIAGVLVVPGMIDWNHYKGDIQAQAKALTGRQLTIGGDIKITVLPAPALIANGVALANLEGAASPHMARLKLLEVRIALAPLLAGRVEVKRIKLVDPVIELEVLADGRKNWSFDAGRTNTAAVPPAAGATASPPATAPTAPPAAPAAAPAGTGAARVAFENFTITNGTLIYRDAKAGTVERIEQIAANFSAASLTGPFESGGSLKVRGLPLSFDAKVGEIIQGRTVPFNLKLGMAPGNATLQLVGTAVGLEGVPKVKGKMKGSGASLARLIEAAQPGAALPPFLGQDFGFEGNLAGAVDGVAIKDLSLRFGTTQATGEITVDASKTLTVTARVAASRVDLDKWLAIGVAPAVGADPQPAAKGSAAVPAAKAPAPAAQATTAAFAIPRDVSGSLALSAEAVTFRGGLIKHAVFNAELNNGEVTVSQLSAQLPGGSDLAVFGFVTAVEGQPRFEGELESTVNDFHGVMTWLGAGVDGLAPDRLRKLTLATRVAATPKQAEFRNLDLQFDSSRLTGGVTVALTKRPSFGADIILDRLNLDPYLPDGSAAPAKPAAGAPERGAAKKPATTPAAAAKSDNVLAVLKPLTEFDANLKARVNTLVLRGNQIKDVAFDGTLHNGRLEIRRLAIAKMPGATASVAGIVDKLGGQPTAAGLKFDVVADDPPRFLRFAGVNAPVPPKDLGAVTLKGRLDGALNAPRLNLRLEGAGAAAVVDGQIDGLDAIPQAKKLRFQLTAADAARLLRLAGVDAPAAKSLGAVSATGELDGTLVQPTLALTVKAAGGALTVNGPVSVLAAGDMVNFTLAARHPDTAVLLKTLGGGYRPVGPIGALDVTGKLAGGPAAVTLSELAAKLGDAQIGGNIAIALTGARPKVTATLTAGAVVLDAFLPAQKAASLDAWPGSPRVVPAATAPVDARWSRDPLDLSGLAAIDGEIAFSSPLVQVQKYRLEAADVGVRLANGRLTADRLNGRMFGGALNATAVASTTRRPRVETVFNLEAMSVNQATAAVTGQALATGTMSMKGKLQTSGGSVADMIAGLGGDGSFAMKGVDVSQAGGGSAMAGAFGLVAALNQFTGVLGGARPGDGLADISGSFQMAGGVGRSADLKLVSGLGNGAAQGSVDLARWRIDVAGQMQLSQNVLTALLERRTGAKVTQAVPFTVQGRLDAPTVRLDTSKLPGGVLPVPGVDKLLKKAPPAVGGLIQGILGGGQPGQDPGTAGEPAPTQAQPQQQQPQQQQPTTQQKKIRPEDILKDLFRR